MRFGLAARYAAGTIGLRRDDVLLASFPRSGSTLLRFLLTHYVLAAGGEGRSLTFDQLNRLAPELGAARLWGRPAPVPGTPRWVKTHRPYTWALAVPQAVLLIRSPLDALASYHRYWTARLGTRPVERGAFLRDARRGLPRWILHTQSWLPRVIQVLEYQDLRTDPIEATSGVLRALGTRVDSQAMAEAAARSSAEAVRAVEDVHGAAGTDRLEGGARFVAGQPSGNGTTYFERADVAWARAQLREAGLVRWAREGVA